MSFVLGVKKIKLIGGHFFKTQPLSGNEFSWSIVARVKYFITLPEKYLPYTHTCIAVVVAEFCTLIDSTFVHILQLLSANINLLSDFILLQIENDH